MMSTVRIRRSFFFLMIRRPPRSTPFPTRRSSDLSIQWLVHHQQDLLDSGLHLVHKRRVSRRPVDRPTDRKSTRLNSSHANISYAVFCLKKKTNTNHLISSLSSLTYYSFIYLLTHC